MTISLGIGLTLLLTISFVANNLKTEIIQKPKYNKIGINRKNVIILKFGLSAASKFHRLVDPNFKKQKNNSIFIYKKKI